MVGDVGCGSGFFTAAMCSWAFAAHGCDTSSEEVRLARSLHPNCDFAACPPDGTFPWPSDFCDAVWCSEVLEHVLDVPAFLREIRRVLKPDGLLILTTPFHGLAKNIAVALLNFTKHYDPLGFHIRFFDRRGLVSCLRDSGCTVTSISGIGRVWPFYRSFFVVARASRP